MSTTVKGDELPCNAPSMAFKYPRPVPALLLRTAYLGETPRTDNITLRVVDVLGLNDPAPAKATRALIQHREGDRLCSTWVLVENLASDVPTAVAKTTPHLSALLATRAPSKMAVKTVAGGADKPLPTPPGYCPECWRRGRSIGLPPSGECHMAHLHPRATEKEAA